MDFLKKKSSPDDDDIIELTDIIEKGKGDSPAKNNANQAIETQMDSLFSGGNNDSQPVVPEGMDADIDALLAEMQPTDSTNSPASPANSGSPASPRSAPPLNVDEELDMPNMAEVDALLEGMDIPPQPANVKESSPPSAAAGESLDDLLDGLLDGAPASTKPTAAPKPSSPPAATPSASSAMDLDDLDDLFAEAAPTQKTEAAAAKAAAMPSAEAAPAAVNDLDDLDALFAENIPSKPAATPPAAPASPAAASAASPAAAPAASAAMDLDDLDALFAEAAPTQKTEATAAKAAAMPSAEAAPAAVNDLDDLDALFAENIPSKPAATPPAASSSSAAAPAASAAMDLDDLDALFAEAAPTQKAEATAAKNATTPSADAAPASVNDLDDLDALFAENIPSKPVATPPAASASSAAAPAASAAMDLENLDDKNLSLDDALDALLGAAPATVAPASKGQQPVAADEPAAAPTDSPAPAASVTSAVGTGAEADDLDALFASAQEPSAAEAPAEAPAVVPPASEDNSSNFRSIEDDLDDILGSLDSAPDPAAPPSTEAADEEAADEEAVDMSDLDTASSDEEENFLADIFDKEKSASAKSSDLEADLLEGLDVLDGLDDPIQPKETLVEFSPTEQDADPVSAAVDTDTLDFSMLSDNPADLPTMPSAQVEDLPLPELAELDQLLQENIPSPAADSFEELPPVSAEGPLLHGFGEDFTEEDIAHVAQELLDEKMRESASIDNVDTAAWLSSLDAILEEDEEGEAAQPQGGLAGSVPSPDDAAVNLDNVLAHLSDAEEQGHYVYSPQSSGTGQMDANTASMTSPCTSCVPPIPFEQAYEQELARLQEITDRFASSLVEADARIATLTQQAKSEVALDSLFRADSPFSVSLQQAVGAALAAELRSHSPNVAPHAEADAALALSDTVQAAAAQAAAAQAGLEQNAAALAEAAEAVFALSEAQQQLQAEHSALTEKVHYLEEQVQNLHAQLEGRDEAQHAILERLNALEDGNKEARLQTVETHVKGQVANTEILDEQYKQLEAQLENLVQQQAHTAEILDEHYKQVEARLEKQEQQQANFEQYFQHEVEKAAAAAAARIIREEIAGILAGQE